MVDVTCLTSVAEIAEALDGDRPNLFVAFEVNADRVDVEIQLRVARPDGEGGARIVGVLPDGQIVTLVISTVAGYADLDITVGSARRLAAYLHGQAETPVLVLAAEQYLRWKQHLILWGAPEPPDAFPFAGHPALHELPRAARVEIASHLQARRLSAAARVLRLSRPDIAIADATTVIGALRMEFG